MPGIVGLTDLVERYFYSSQWLWISIGSLVYLFFRMNTARKRAFLAALAFFFLFVNSFVIEKFTALGENGTFYRHLWAIPTIVIVGIAVVDVAKIVPRWYFRILIIATFIVGIWYVNSQEYIRLRGLPLSADGKMVSEDVIQLSEEFEEIKKKEGKDTIFVVCGNQATELALYSGYLDVTGPSILNNSEHNGEVELTGETPDVEYIMSVCCSNGLDYVIVSRNEGAENTFASHGYDPCFISNTYLVYHCSGYKGFIQDKNSWGQITKKTYFDENGQCDQQEMGYCTILYAYDERGNKVEELYYGSDNELCFNSFGYAGVKYEYNILRKCVKETYLDQDKNACNLASGYASIERSFTADGLLKSIKYFDQNGNPAYLNGYHEMQSEHNRKNECIEERYLDENGRLVLNKQRYAYIEYSYDYQGNLVIWQYFDTEGHPTIITDGYAKVQRVYDDRGNIIEESYYDTEGKRALRAAGYSIVRRLWNENGQLVREEYLGLENEPINNINGIAGFERYYEGWNLVEEKQLFAESVPK